MLGLVQLQGGLIHLVNLYRAPAFNNNFRVLLTVDPEISDPLTLQLVNICFDFGKIFLPERNWRVFE